MNNWLMIRRLRGPAYVLLVGIMAMLEEWTNFGFGRSWPLFLILAGLFALAERAALSQANPDAYDPATGQPRQPFATGAYPTPGTAIVPAASTTTPESDSGTGRL